MRSAWWMSAVFLLGSCSGEPPVTRPDPEICDDGIDNDGDGGADCDDTDCGGLHCQTNGNTETGEELPMAEVLYDPSTCCDFVFGPDDCPQMQVGTISFINRSESDDATVTLSCNLIGGSVAAVRWMAEGDTQPRPFITDETLPAGTTLPVEAWFVCDGVNQTFTTSCIAHVEIEGTDADEVTFEITGTSAE
jgi:hypothetical protein